MTLQLICVAIVATIYGLQLYGQRRFNARCKKITELQRKYLANEMEMCRLRDIMIEFINTKDWESFNLTNELINKKINESLSILDSIKDVTKKY